MSTPSSVWRAPKKMPRGLCDIKSNERHDVSVFSAALRFSSTRWKQSRWPAHLRHVPYRLLFAGADVLVELMIVQE